MCDTLRDVRWGSVLAGSTLESRAFITAPSVMFGLRWIHGAHFACKCHTFNTESFCVSLLGAARAHSARRSAFGAALRASVCVVMRASGALASMPLSSRQPEPIIKALKGTYPERKSAAVLEDNDPSGFKSSKGVAAKAEAPCCINVFLLRTVYSSQHH